jgi:hypothetical protein
MDRLAKVLRIAAIVMLSLTAAMTVLSGVGATCVAFGAENFPSMAALVPYKPLYQAIVFLTLAVGIAAVVAAVAFAKGRRWAYLGSLAILAAGIAVGAVHMIASQRLRGSAAPGNMRVYLSAITVIVLLILRIPGVWQRLGLRQGGDVGSPSAPAGAALIAAGLATVTAPLWAAPTHIFDGNNWAHFMDAALLTGGGILLAAGIGLLAWGLLARRAVQTEAVRGGAAR